MRVPDPDPSNTFVPKYQGELKTELSEDLKQLKAADRAYKAAAKMYYAELRSDNVSALDIARYTMETAGEEVGEMMVEYQNKYRYSLYNLAQGVAPFPMSLSNWEYFFRKLAEVATPEARREWRAAQAQKAENSADLDF